MTAHLNCLKATAHCPTLTSMPLPPLQLNLWGSISRIIVQRFNALQKNLFIQEEAIYLPENNQTPWLTRLWTAKEAIYKAMREPGLSLAQNINVAPFSMKDNQGVGSGTYPRRTNPSIFSCNFLPLMNTN